MRDQLLAMLSERGITNPDQLVGSLVDLQGAVRTVEYWDDKPGTNGPGLLIHLLRSGDHNGYERKASPSSRSARFWLKVTDMEALGFEGPRAQFAASAALMMDALKVDPTRERLMARVEAQYGETS